MGVLCGYDDEMCMVWVWFKLLFCIFIVFFCLGICFFDVLFFGNCDFLEMNEIFDWIFILKKRIKWKF